MGRVQTGLARTLFTFAALLAGLLGPPLRAADPEIPARLAALMETRSRERGFSGSVLVARDGVPLLRRSFGMANLEHDVPNTTETKFRIGSLTKQFTAAAVLILQEQGKLDVQNPVKTYLTSAPAAWDGITVHHLLTHTAGIPDYTAFREYEETMRTPAPPDSLIARFSERPLSFKPGERFAYSNSGYAVLGRTIERVSGMSYAAFLRTQIFAPLEMNDSGYDEPGPVLKHRASGYRRAPQGAENARLIDMSIPYAAGGLYSTVDDLLKWDRALSSERLLSKKSKDAMFTPFLQKYGYGWRITRMFDRAMVAHSGGVNGFASHIRRFPDDGICIIILSNVAGTPVPALGDDLAAVVFGKGG